MLDVPNGGRVDSSSTWCSCTFTWELFIWEI